MKLKAVFAGLTICAALLAADQGAELFQKAVTQEQAAGNLQEAIRLYQKVAKDYASNRPLAAKALIQIGRCYEKLGQSEATKFYQQVARDFSDQREYAETARARLAAMKSAAPAAASMRRIEFGAGVSDIVDTDGERAIYWDDAHTTLYAGDVAGKNKQILYKNASSQVEAYVSPDMALVFLELSPTGPYAVTHTDSTGYRDLPLRFQRSPVHTQGLTWSWDNRFVLRTESEPDATSKLQRISVADGQVQDIVPSWKAGIIGAWMSPDGQFVAFRSAENDVGAMYIAATQGGSSPVVQPHLVAEQAGNGFWTSDGKYFIIQVFDRLGRGRLVAQAIQNGQTVGEPVFLRDSEGYGKTHARANGPFVVERVPEETKRVLLGTPDRQGHVSAWETLDLVNYTRNAQWSPEGGRIAYVGTPNHTTFTGVVRIHDMNSGQDRELFRSTGVVGSCVWANQHPTLFCTLRSAGSRGITDIYSISVDSGRAEKVGSLQGHRHLQAVSLDDRRIHVARLGGDEVAGAWWEIGTGRETPAEGFACEDGQWLYTSRRITEEGRELAVRTPESSEWKRLTYLKIPLEPALTPPMVYCVPGGNAIVYRDFDASGKDGLYRISTLGGQPERIGDYPKGMASPLLKVNSKGQLLMVEGPGRTAGAEYWLWENFEPKPKAAK
jgi:hypothetical protein